MPVVSYTDVVIPDQWLAAECIPFKTIHFVPANVISVNETITTVIHIDTIHIVIDDVVCNVGTNIHNKNPAKTIVDDIL